MPVNVGVKKRRKREDPRAVVYLSDKKSEASRSWSDCSTPLRLVSLTAGFIHSPSKHFNALASLFVVKG